MADKYSDPTMPGPSNGVLQGPDMSMPDRGTSSGVADSYGADLGINSTNRMKGLGRSTQSDPMDQCYGYGGGDFSSSGHSSPSYGSSMGSAAKSDGVNVDRADDPKQ